MKLREISFTLLVFALSIIFISGCAQDSGTGEQVSDANKPEDKGEPVELIIHSDSRDSVESFDLRFGNAIREQFPDYTITYIQSGEGTSKQDLFAAGQTIDINFDTIGYFMGSMVENDLQYDMTELINNENIDLTQLDETAVEGMRTISGGEMWGIPVTNLNVVLLYNKDLFDKFGVPYPQDGLTWAEAIELSKTLTRELEGQQILGLASQPGHILRTNQYSLSNVDPESLKSTVGTNEKWKVLLDTIFVQPASTSGYREFMIENEGAIPAKVNFTNHRNLAMYIGLSSTVFTSVDEMEGMNWDIATMPVFEELPGVGSQPYPLYFSVTNVSEHKEEAMEVINYLISEEFQTILSQNGDIPVLTKQSVRDAFAQNSPFQDKNWSALFHNESADISLKTTYDGIVEGEIRAVLPDMVLGQTDINTAVRTVDEKANQLIVVEEGR